MMIAAIQNGTAPRSGVTRRPERRAKPRAEPGRGKIRHVLHGWRILGAALVAQVLERCPEDHAAVPVAYALGAYRRRQAAPPPLHILSDI